MNSRDIQQTIRNEINRRRRHGGAEDVPALLWETDAVLGAVEQATACAEEESFTGDWDYASVNLESKLNRIASTLLAVSKQSHSAFPSGFPSGFVPSASASKELGKVSANVTRQDLGSRALSEYLSWHFQKDFIAEWCRDEVCGGEFLTSEEAWEFLTSPLPKILGIEDYQQLGVCPARTAGRILAQFWSNEKKIDADQEAVFIRPDNLRFKAEYGLHYATSGSERECYYGIEVMIPASGDQKPFRKRLVIPRCSREHVYVFDAKAFNPQRITRFTDRLSFGWAKPVPHFPDETRYAEGYENSAMGVLLIWADFLCESYHVEIWDMLEAFLTGKFPAPNAVKIKGKSFAVVRTEYDDSQGSEPGKAGWLRRVSCVSAQGPVTLTVQPWVTPEVLADAWREHRKDHAGYSPSEKQADALRFVLSHTMPGEEFGWERLAQQWQEERGELMMRGQLYKQFQRARATILPGFREVDE